MIKHEVAVKELVRYNSDGIMLLMSGIEKYSRGLEDEIFDLKKFMLDQRETKGSVLLVLVDHAGKEVRREESPSPIFPLLSRKTSKYHPANQYVRERCLSPLSSRP